MVKKLIFLAPLLSGHYLAAMEQTKPLSLEKESSHNEVLVKILLTDSDSSDTIHEAAIPLRLARLIGSIAGYLQENPELNETGFPLPLVTLGQWRIIVSQLERLPSIMNEDSDDTRSRKTIIEEYERLDAKDLIELIHALDYVDIPLLLEIACDVVIQSCFWRFTFEQINSVQEFIGNRFILQKIFHWGGPFHANALVVCRGHEELVYSVCVTRDGKIVSSSEDKTVRLWDMQGKELVVCRGHDSDVISICVATDGKIVSGSYDGTIYVCDMQGKADAVCRVHDHSIGTVCVTNDGKIVSGSRDKTVRLWDMQCKELVVCRGHEAEVVSVCATKDGKIVSGSCDTTVRLWNMQGNELVVCRGHDCVVISVCVTRDGKIVSGSWDTTVRVWDRQGKQLAGCLGHEGAVESVCVTDDGKIVSGSRDTTVRVWDMLGKELAVCRGHRNEVRSVCLTNDGKIVSGSMDSTIRVWNMQGEELMVCRGHEGMVYSVCVTSDCKIVSGSSDNTVRVWDVSLLDSINRMDQFKSGLLWELLQRNCLQFQINKEELWKEIMEIIGDVALGACATDDSKND